MSSGGRYPKSITGTVTIGGAPPVKMPFAPAGHSHMGSLGSMRGVTWEEFTELRAALRDALLILADEACPPDVRQAALKVLQRITEKP